MRILIALAAIAAFTVAAACSSGDDGVSSSGMTRKAKVGDITMEATLMDAASGIALRPELEVFPLDTLVIFAITLDTHSTDLSNISLAAAAVLHQVGPGTVPRAWMPTKEEAHHVEGILLFSRLSESGPVTLVTDLGDDKPVEMTWESQVP